MALHPLTYYPLLGLLFFMCRECSCLKSLVINVPEVIKSGDTVTMSCDYDLEQVALYTIKWYLNEVEFYRFVPKESPPYKAFTMPYMTVDTSRSSKTTVTLVGVRRQSSGTYKCEVSADAPLFHTDMKSAYMNVVDLPNGNPVMNIEPLKVEIGKKIKARCYTPGADPPANLTFHINDEKVNESTESIELYPLAHETDQVLDLHSSSLQMDVTTHRSYFRNGVMTVTCKASIFTIWEKSVEGQIRDDTPQLAPVLGSTSSQTHSGAMGLEMHGVFYSATKNSCKLHVFLIECFLIITFLFR